MASVKYRVLPPSYVSWWKHMKKFGKRHFWKRNRQAGKVMTRKERPTHGE